MQPLLIYALGWIGSCAAQCSRIVMRREIRELSEREVRDFVGALNRLHREKWEGFSKYEEFTRLHFENKDVSHFTPQFLPWHRHFIRKLEKELQRINPRVVLPYWDWSLDSQEPHNSPVLSRRFVGGNGDPSGDFCLREGPFANWQMGYPTPHCLRRNYDAGDRITPFSTPEAMSIDLNEPRFSEFSLQLELKHGSPHVGVGGERGDLYPMHSPNDPLFYLHHTFIDMLWAEWQSRHPAAIYEGNRYRRTATVGDLLIPFNYTVQSTLDTHSDFYCYSYPRYPRPLVPKDTPPRLRLLVNTLSHRNPFLGPQMAQITQTNAEKKLPALLRGSKERLSDLDIQSLKAFPLKQRRPLPAAFVKMNHMDPRDVVAAARAESSFVNLLNSFPSFVSLAQIQTFLNAQEDGTLLSSVVSDTFNDILDIF